MNQDRETIVARIEGATILTSTMSQMLTAQCDRKLKGYRVYVVEADTGFKTYALYNEKGEVVFDNGSAEAISDEIDRLSTLSH